MRVLFLFSLMLAAGSANAQVDLSPPRTVWDSDLDGTALHRISTLQCPTANGTFRRFDVQLYDKVGFDVGCDYRADAGEITLYLTQIDPAEFDHHFETARKALADRFPDAVSRGGTLPLPPGFEWRHASFLLRSGMISDVLMTPFHGWYFEARISYRPEGADATAKTLAELAALALKTAGQHLAACETRAPLLADGRRVTDKDKVQALGLATGVLLGAIVIKGKVARQSEPLAEPLSCADGSFAIGKDNFVFWRDTPATGVAVERISGIERGFTATTRDALTDVLAELSAAKEQAAAQPKASRPPGVVVLVDHGEDWDVMAVFEGLPSMKDMAEAALLGRPIARVSKAGNKTTIFTEPAAK